MADITSLSNSRIKLARKLQRKRHREQMGLCLLEGWRLIEDAWTAGAEFDTLFVLDTEEATAEIANPALIERMGQRHLPLFTVTRPVMDALTETVSHQGVAALVRIPHLTPPLAPSLLLILDQVRDPGNVGTLLRSAAAAGVDLVLLGPETADAYNDKVLRAGMGAHFRLPLRACADWHEIESILGSHAIYVADASGAMTYDEVNWQQPSALIIGGEARGAGDAARRMGTPIAIPMHRATESLNAAVAGSIILFEAMRQRRHRPH